MVRFSIYLKRRVFRNEVLSCSLSYVNWILPSTVNTLIITKTYLYNFDILKPHFYIVKLGFTGVYIMLPISAQKHRLWVLDEAVLTGIHNLSFEQKYEKYQNFYLSVFGGEIFNIFE